MLCLWSGEVRAAPYRIRGAIRMSRRVRAVQRTDEGTGLTMHHYFSVLYFEVSSTFEVESLCVGACVYMIPYTNVFLRM